MIVANTGGEAKRSLVLATSDGENPLVSTIPNPEASRDRTVTSPGAPESVEDSRTTETKS